MQIYKSTKYLPWVKHSGTSTPHTVLDPSWNLQQQALAFQACSRWLPLVAYKPFLFSSSFAFLDNDFKDSPEGSLFFF